jgi:glycosyltransferase involved in cell wall biosynthesis
MSDNPLPRLAKLGNKFYREKSYLKAASCYQAVHELIPRGGFDYLYRLALSKYFFRAPVERPEYTSTNTLAEFLSSLEWVRAINNTAFTEIFFEDHQRIRVKSRQPKAGHSRVYAWSELIFHRPPLDQPEAPISLLFNIDILSASDRSSVKLVLKFLDEAEEIIAPCLCNNNDKTFIKIPPNTRAIKVGFKIVGDLEFQLSAIHANNTLANPTPSSDTSLICIAPDYPSNHSRYRFAFIHSRLKLYHKHGIQVEVVTIASHPMTVERWHEGIRVVELSHKDLPSYFHGNSNLPLAIHSISPQTYKLISKYLCRRKVFAWSHGYDYQPWMLRQSLVKDEKHRRHYRANTMNRKETWNKLIEQCRENLTIVFVSRYQAEEFLCQIVKPNTLKIAIISNPINTETFQFNTKSSEQRKNILSLRPYHNSLYANDLAAKAACFISSQNCQDFFFVFAGDGPLFDETLGPLKKYPNILVLKDFFSADQIAMLHKDFGIFLVPSRMDTHGVSRDEAMSSGLVPITTNIAAIPEFVDSQCAVITPPEDWRALASSVIQIGSSPELFLQLSQNAASRVRRSTAHFLTIPREVSLILQNQQAEIAELDFCREYIAILGDLNLNIMDGSSTWAASVCQMLATSSNDIEIHLYSKTPLYNLEVVSPLLALSTRVRIVEPEISETESLSYSQLAQSILENNKTYQYQCYIFRGLDLNVFMLSLLAKSNVVAYLTDIPQVLEDMLNSKALAFIRSAVASNWRLGLQTPSMMRLVKTAMPELNESNALLMQPSIPDSIFMQSIRQIKPFDKAKLTLVYAGKFAIDWYINELLDIYKQAQVQDLYALSIFGDKFHKYEHYPDFGNDLQLRLLGSRSIAWTKKVPRQVLINNLFNSHVGWCFRNPVMEASCLELSTKVIEYCATGVIPILYPNQVNIEFLGNDYPFFVSTLDEARDALLQLPYYDASRLNELRITLRNKASYYTHSSQAKEIIRKLIL